MRARNQQEGIMRLHVMVGFSLNWGLSRKKPLIGDGHMTISKKAENIPKIFEVRYSSIW